MRHLDLFSGIGGFSLACSWHGITTTQFVEKEPYCQRVLAKNFPGVPIHDDITTYYPRLGEFDLVTFGSPCQDFSSANPNGRGLEGERSGLFFEAIRIVRTVQPRFALFENVPNVLNRGFERILWEFTQIGMLCEWQIVSAASMGAPHRRERLFVIAYPMCSGLEKQDVPAIAKRSGFGSGCCDAIATNTNSITGLQASSTASPIGIQGQSRNNAMRRCNSTPNTKSQRSPRNHANQGRTDQTSLFGASFWQRSPHPEPTICRVDARLPSGVATRQLKALGNTVVPQCAEIPIKRILELDSHAN